MTTSNRLRFAFLAALTIVIGQLTITGHTAAAVTAVDTRTFTGTITPADPTMPVVSITKPTCVSQGAFQVHYHVIPLTILASGQHDISTTSPNGFASMYLYEGSFDPANPLTNCVAADNTGNPTVTISYSATAGTPYFIVVFDDTFLQAGGDYQTTVQSPATADLGVAITADGGPYDPGTAVGLTVDVTNAGLSDAPNAVAVITLPAQFVGGSFSNLAVTGPAYACLPGPTGLILTCTAASHSVGATAQFTFDATLATSGAAVGQPGVVSAEVSSGAPDPVPANNSASVTVAPPTFVPLTPSRILNTRGGAKVGNAEGTGAPFVLKVAGVGGVPASGVAAVALNVTVTQSENPTIGGGFVTVYPCDQPRPDASSLNFVTDQTVPNSVIAPVSASGEVCFYVYGTTHLLADVSGYFPTGAGFKALTPTRIMNTRGGAKVGNAEGTGAPFVLKVAGVGGVPASGVAAVVLNVTVTQSENPTIGGGFVTVYPCDRPRPDASNLNFVTDQTVPNAVIAPVSASGEVCFYVYGTTHLLADVSGYIESGAGFTSLTPSRIMNTRGGAKVGDAAGTGAPFVLKVAGAGGVPATGVRAVVLNVTVTLSENPTIGGGFVTVYPCDRPRPDASNLNFVTDQTVPNAVIAPVSANGEVCFYVYGTTHLLADVSGYFV